MTDEHNPEAVAKLLERLRDNRHMSHYGAITGTGKAVADMLEALAAKLAEAEANQHRLECENTERLRALMAAEAERDQAKKFRDFVLAKGSDAVKRAKAAEAEMSRLRTAQDAMVGAVIEAAAQAAYQWWDDDDAHELRTAIRALRPDATSALERMLREARNAALEEALAICTDYGFSRASECREAIAALVAQEERGAE